MLDLILKNFLLIRIFEERLAEGAWESSLDSCLGFSVVGNGSPYGKNQLWKQAWIQIFTLLPAVCVLMWVQLKGCSQPQVMLLKAATMLHLFSSKLSQREFFSGENCYLFTLVSLAIVVGFVCLF